MIKNRTALHFFKFENVALHTHTHTHWKCFTLCSLVTLRIVASCRLWLALIPFPIYICSGYYVIEIGEEEWGKKAPPRRVKSRLLVRQRPILKHTYPFHRHRPRFDPLLLTAEEDLQRAHYIYCTQITVEIWTKTDMHSAWTWCHLLSSAPSNKIFSLIKIIF